MEQRNRVRWWDGRTGSDVIGDLTPQGWTFAEREYCDVRRYSLAATEELVQKANSLLRESNKKKNSHVRRLKLSRNGSPVHVGLERVAASCKQRNTCNS